MGLVAWLLGIAVALSFNEWSGFKILGLGIFDLLDTLTTKIMMPLAGMLIALFVGWVMRRHHVAEEMGLSGAQLGIWLNVLRFGSPLAIGLIFLHVVGVMG